MDRRLVIFFHGWNVPSQLCFGWLYWYIIALFCVHAHCPYSLGDDPFEWCCCIILRHCWWCLFVGGGGGCCDDRNGDSFLRRRFFLCPDWLHCRKWSFRISSVGDLIQYEHLCLMSNWIFLLEIYDEWNAEMSVVARWGVCLWCLFVTPSRWSLLFSLTTYIFPLESLLLRLHETVVLSDDLLCYVCNFYLHILQRVWIWYEYW